MENYLYTCQYCGKEYKPNRRKKQKYCSNSCRTRAFVIKKGIGLAIIKPEITKPEENKIDKMSTAGVGNVIVGTLIADGIGAIAKNIFTNEENKPATKKDLKEMKELLLPRYHRVNNLPPNRFGQLPYYDLNTKTIIYFKT